MIATPAGLGGSATAANLLAGLSVAGLLIPEALAYAGIAGLPPLHALIASVAGVVGYACVGGSRFAIVTPTSSSAAIVAAAIGASGAAAVVAGDRIAFSGAVVALVGVLFLLGAALRIGHLAAFISRPVLRGFAFGLAITIVIKQLPAVVGIAVHGPHPAQTLLFLGERIGEWNPWSIAIGVAAYASLRLIKTIPRVPAAFAVVLAGIFLARILDLPSRGVALVGAIPLADWSFRVPELSHQLWLRAAELAFPLVVILYAESWGSIRTLALRHGDATNPSRELAGLGAANLLSGVLQGMPVGAGFSASSANEDAGAQGRMAGIVAAGIVVVLVASAGRWLALLPEPVLAAVVISALTHALNPRPILALWRLGRDEVLATSAALAVVALGVLDGMLLAVLLSVVAAVRRFSQSRVAVLGELAETRDYIDVSRHPDAVVSVNLLIVRPEEPLFFANVESAFAEIRRLTQQQRDIFVVVLSLENSTDLDSTAIEALAELELWIRGSQRSLLLARVKENVRELLQRGEATAPSTPCFWSVADAVEAARLVLDPSQRCQRQDR